MFQAITPNSSRLNCAIAEWWCETFYTQFSFKRWIEMLNFWLDTGYSIILLCHAFCTSNSFRLMSLPQTASGRGCDWAACHKVWLFRKVKGFSTLKFPVYSCVAWTSELYERLVYIKTSEQNKKKMQKDLFI